MTYDLTDTTRYTVWACYADKPDEAYAEGLTLWQAEFVVNEMNSIDDAADYRCCAEDFGMTPDEEYAAVMATQSSRF
jgi:hypothetical protein